MKRTCTQLSPNEREEIHRLYSSGKFTQRQLGERFGVSKTTIQNVMKAIDKKKEEDRIKNPRINPGDLSPSEFRILKMKEICSDIELSRARGSVHVLPNFHRLHLQIHDELKTIREEEAQQIAELSDDGLIASIIGTIAKLPPVVRHQIQDHLDGLESGAVIQFPEEESG